MKRTGGNRECDGLLRGFHFVPLEFSGMTGDAGFFGNPDKKISSTKIRRILADEVDLGVMLKPIFRVALNPTLLVEIVSKRRQWVLG